MYQGIFNLENMTIGSWVDHFRVYNLLTYLPNWYFWNTLHVFLKTNLNWWILGFCFGIKYYLITIRYCSSCWRGIDSSQDCKRWRGRGKLRWGRRSKGRGSCAWCARCGCYSYWMWNSSEVNKKRWTLLIDWRKILKLFSFSSQ